MCFIIDSHLEHLGDILIKLELIHLKNSAFLCGFFLTAFQPQKKYTCEPGLRANDISKSNHIATPNSWQYDSGGLMS